MAEFVVDGNADPVVGLPATINGVVAKHYRYRFNGSGYTWSPGGVIPDSGSMPATGKTPSMLNATDIQSVTLTTRGMAITGPQASQTQYVDFAPCTMTPSENCNWIGARRYRFRIDPDLTISPAASIQVDGTYSRQVQLVWPVALTNRTVTAACEIDSGALIPATISVSPATDATNSSGVADFSITAAKLRLIAPSGPAPSGRCRFKAHPDSTKQVVVEVQGVRVAPGVDVSPHQVNVPTSGTTQINQLVTVQTDNPEPGAIVQANCTAESPAQVKLDNVGPVATVSAEKTADANGRVTFQVLATKLITVPPIGSPHVRCRFNVKGISSTDDYLAVGRQIAPQVSLDRNQITSTGVTTVTATVSPAYPDLTVGPSCTGNGVVPAVTATPVQSTTDSSGRQSFQINTPQLVVVDANTATQPSLRCDFRVVNAGNTASLLFRTGNACSMALSPLPSGCGNP